MHWSGSSWPQPVGQPEHDVEESRQFGTTLPGGSVSQVVAVMSLRTFGVVIVHSYRTKISVAPAICHESVDA